ncbi:MAG: penicillin-binding protein, partial [Clostridia bacterium]|nr:penicillin-binding protein [Clostridia bacterium]
KGAYGIQNASKVYFNKDSKNLTLNESCILASIIKSPNYYSPYNNYDALINRKNFLLKTLYNENIISKSVYDYNVNEKIEFTNHNENYISDYLMEVNEKLDDVLYYNPYENKRVKVYTYLDQALQKQIATKEQDYNYKQIVINSKNNGVIAYFGKNSNLKRQVASCIKPIYVYAPMINEKLINSSTVIIDEKINYSGYEPKNYGNVYHGPVTVKTALSKSLNIPSVKLLDAFGIDKANEYAKKFNVGLKGNDLTASLGNTENGLTLKELTDCYSPFSNEGIYNKSSFIKKIVVNDNVVYENQLQNNQIFSKETAYIMNDILLESVKSGTAKKLKAFNFEVCSKTGTNGTSKGNLDEYNVTYTS